MRTSSAGFTILYAVLITSLLLAIGLAIFNIAIKEVILSSAARESQFAFYAADSGVECAIFWDLQGGAFSTTTSSSVTCAGQTVSDIGGRGWDVPSTFTLDFAPEPYCAVVSVTKQESPRRTLIESRGYNTCDTDNPRRTERAIRAKY